MINRSSILAAITLFLFSLLFPSWSIAAYSAKVNLADAKCGLILSGSDALEDYEFQTGNAFDGKSNTAWVTGNDMTVHWLECCWYNQVVAINEISLDFTPVDFNWRTYGQLFNNTKPELRSGRTSIPTEVRISIMVNNRYSDVATLKMSNLNPTLKYKFVNPTVDVQKLKISFNSQPKENFAVRELKIIGENPVIQKIEPQFSNIGGGWIWGDPKPLIPEKSLVQQYFRRVFETENGEIDKVVLSFAASNRGAIYLNGKEIAQSPDSGMFIPAIVRVEVPAKSLNAGKNLIAAHAVKTNNVVGIQGIIFQLAIKYKNNKIQYVCSDNNKCNYSSRADPGWNSNFTGFTDWKSAKVSRGANSFGIDSWGLDYSLPFFSDSVIISKIELDPKIPRAGEKYLLKITVEAPEALSASYGIIAEFGELPIMSPTCISMLLGKNYLLPDNGLKSGFKGTCTLSMTGTWPHGASNRIPMRLTVCNGKQQAEIVAGGVGTVSDSSAPGKLNCYLGADEVKFPSKDFPRVSTLGGRLIIDGKPVAPIIYTSNTITPGRFADFLEKDSINIFRIQPQFGSYIISDDQNTDLHNKKFMTALERTVMTVCRMSPEAKFLVVLSVDFPIEWNLKHPDSQILLGDGSNLIHRDHINHPDVACVRESVSSGAVRKKLYDDIKRFISELRKQPYANSILGIVIFQGRAGENNWGLDINAYKDANGKVAVRDRNTMLIGDFSIDGRYDLAEFLKNAYVSDKAWAESWKVPDADARICDVTDSSKWPIERFLKDLAWKNRPNDRFIFRDGIKDGKISEDFFKSMGVARANLYLEVARAVKDASDNRLLVGGFIGYTVPYLTNSPPGIAQHNGHLMTSMVRESRFFDFICSPHVYHMRRMGDPVMPMGTTDSMRLHNKLFINEFDTRTYLSPIKPKTFSQWETVHQMRKEFGYALIKDQAYWLLEFPFALSGPQANPWFSDPMIIQDQALARKVYQEHVKNDPVEKAGSEIAIFVSEHGPLYVDIYSPSNTVHSNLINVLLPKFTMTGTPFEIFALEDLPRLVKEGLHKKYKMIVFLNAFHLDRELRTIINQDLKSDKRTLLFFYAPGYHSSDFNKETSLSLAGIEDVIEMKGINKLAQASIIGMELTPDIAQAIQTVPSHDAKGWWEELQIKTYKDQIGPIFFLKNTPDSQWQSLACLRIDGQINRDKIALAKFSAPNYSVIYSAIPDLPTNLISKLVKDSGAHCYVNPGTVVYANKYFICVNNSFEVREITIKLPGKATWIELFDGKTYGSDTDSVTINFAKGETKIFKLKYK